VRADGARSIHVLSGQDAAESKGTLGLYKSAPPSPAEEAFRPLADGVAWVRADQRKRQAGTETFRSTAKRGAVNVEWSASDRGLWEAADRGSQRLVIARSALGSPSFRVLNIINLPTAPSTCLGLQGVLLLHMPG